MKKLLIASLLLSVGCKTVSKNHGMTSSSSMRAERHQIWTRPLEVGFSMGKELECESTTTKLLGIYRVSGDPINSMPSVSILGATGGLSANAKYAIGSCVEDEKSDGMYVLYTHEEKVMTGFTVTTKATVRGRLLKLKEYGPINEGTINAIRIGDK